MLTAIWQSKNPGEIAWITEIFDGLIGNHVFDGEHKIVLDNCILLDAFINTVPESYYKQFNGKNAFLVHLLDETFEGGYERYNYFRAVLRNFGTRSFNSRHVFQFPCGYWNSPNPELKANSIPASQRKYVWSFDGELNKATRPDAVKAMRPITPYFLRDTGPTYGKPKPVLDPTYQEVVAQSAFVLSPMGNVLLECPRMYEALELGAIPLVEDRLHHPFKLILGDHYPIPSFYTWEKARLFVEYYVSQPKALDVLQKRCVEWWDTFKPGVTRRIAEFIDNAQPATSDELIFDPYLPHRLWQFVELVKYHNIGAIRRRMIRHARRAIIEHRYRAEPERILITEQGQKE